MSIIFWGGWGDSKNMTWAYNQTTVVKLSLCLIHKLVLTQLSLMFIRYEKNVLEEEES